jgi:hypothetical protein
MTAMRFVAGVQIAVAKLRRPKIKEVKTRSLFKIVLESSQTCTHVDLQLGIWLVLPERDM